MPPVDKPSRVDGLAAGTHRAESRRLQFAEEPTAVGRAADTLGLALAAAVYPTAPRLGNAAGSAGDAEAQWMQIADVAARDTGPARDTYTS